MYFTPNLIFLKFVWLFGSMCSWVFTFQNQQYKEDCIYNLDIFIFCKGIESDFASIARIRHWFNFCEYLSDIKFHCLAADYSQLCVTFGSVGN